MTATATAPGRTLAAIIGDHLTTELNLHRRLLEIAEAKQQAVMSGDLAAFSAILTREAAPNAESARLFQVRERLAAGLAERLNLGQRPSMSAIIAALPPSDREALTVRQRDLQAVLVRLQALNERNLLLIRQSLSLVNELMRHLTGGDGDPGAYDRRGSQDAGPGGGRLLDLRG